MCMKYLLILWSTLLLISFSSCATFTQEIWLNDDGSGKISTTYDMSEMLEMIKMMEEMSDDTVAVEEEKEGLEGLFNNSDNFENLDTVFNMYDEMPDSVKALVENPEIMKKMSIQVKANEEEQIAFFSMVIEFDDPDDITEIFKTINESAPDSSKMEAAEYEEMEKQFTRFNTNLEKGMITVDPFDIEDMLGEEYDDDYDFENMSEDEMNMVKMMMGEGEVKTIFHLPGKILEVTSPYATVDDDSNTVTIIQDLYEVIKTKTTSGYTIKYKND